MKTKMQAFLIRTKEVVSKRLLIILLTLGIASGAYAQRFHGGEIGGGGHFYGGGYRTGVIVGGYGPSWGWGWGYPGLYLGYGYPFMFGYPGYPYGYSPYGYGGTSRLQMQLSDIKQDYADRIESVRSDMSLTGKERRQKVRALRHERDNAINDAKRNYWKNATNVPGGNGQGGGNYNNGSNSKAPSTGSSGPIDNNGTSNQ